MWGENGRVGWHRSVGIFVVRDDYTIRKLGVGKKKQRLNCEALVAD